MNVVNVIDPAPNRVVGLGGKSRWLRPGAAPIARNPESERIAAHAADHIELHGVGGVDLHVARAVVGGAHHATELNPVRTAVGAAPHALDVSREIQHVRVARTDLNIHATEGRSGRSGAIDARQETSTHWPAVNAGGVPVGIATPASAVQVGAKTPASVAG